MSRSVELVRVETADGLFLDGILLHPTQTGKLPVDLFLLIHGTGSNFYSPGVLETFAEQAIAEGTAVLRINTRGHDGICSLPGRQGSVRGGATYEKISDCPADLNAWLDWSKGNGFEQIVLVGHSMGGVKAVYSQACANHPSVGAIIGISPPRFCHRKLAEGPRGERFRAEFSRANELAASGAHEALVAVLQPLPFLATAGGYIEKYGPEDRYDYVPLLGRIACPMFFLLGGESLTHSAAFAGLNMTLAKAATTNTKITCEVVAQANINYTRCADIPYQRAAAWLANQFQGN